MIPITVTVQVTPQMIADAVCTAFEAGVYGCRYWLPKARPPRGYKLSGPDVCNWYSDPALWTPGRGHVVTVWEDDGEGDRRHRIEVDNIATRLQVVAAKAPALMARFLDSDNDPLDGPAADEFMQWLVLGAVVYG